MPILAAPLLRPRLPSSQCEVCRSWGRRRLCTDCCARFAPAVARCSRCAIALPVGAAVCGECLRHPPPFARAVSAADYAFPWDALIADFKFHGAVELAAPLAALLCTALQRGGGAAGAQLVLPVPLARSRLAERGFNQAWELARRVAAAFDLEAEGGLLLRPIETVHQASLPRERRTLNLRGAFMVDPRRRNRVHGLHVALVDDVLTTGATAREATQALLRAGAASVQLWTLARTP